MAQETVKQITQGGVTRDVEDEVARQKAGSAIQGVIVNGTEVVPDSGTKKVSFNIPSPAQVDTEMNGTSENAVQNKVIKAYVDGLIQGLQNVLNTITQDGATQGVIDTFNEVVAFLNGINSSDTLAAKLLLKQDALVAGNGIAIAQDGKTVSVDAEVVQPATADGTFAVRIGNNTYTINLNHTHENMAKIVKCTEATRPQTLDNDTIYVQVDNATSPTEIESIYLFGLEFTGGGLPTGVPQISKPTPNSTINLGTAYGQGGATGTVKIKGRSLTANSTVVVSVGSGFSLSYGQQSGSSINIDAADVILGCDVTVYATAYGTSGTILITSQTDSLSVDANLTSDVVEDLTAVKFTGTQGLQTDYTPNPNTEFELDMKFETNANTDRREGFSGGMSSYIFQCNIVDDNAFYFNTTGNESDSYELMCRNDKLSGDIYRLSFLNNHSAMLQRGIMSYKKNANSKMTWSFNGVSDATLPLKTGSPGTLNICYVASTYNLPTNRWNVYIYGLKIMENRVVVRNYKPVTRNGVAGLYDTVHNTFISSNGNDELVAIP